MIKLSEYKYIKDLEKVSLRDNMTDIEVVLTNIGKIAARDIAFTQHLIGLKENLKIASRGVNVAKDVVICMRGNEKSVFLNQNTLNYKNYIENDSNL